MLTNDVHNGEFLSESFAEIALPASLGRDYDHQHCYKGMSECDAMAVTPLRKVSR